MNKLLLALAVSLLSYVASGQQVSPYSRFGAGDVSAQTYTASQAMGGISAAYRSPLNINIINPASFSKLAHTSLEASMRFNTSTYNTGDTSYVAGDGFIDYLALGFPITPSRTGRLRVGASAGLAPYSQMNYNIQQSVVDGNGISYTNLFNGEGRIYDLYLGTGVQISGQDSIVPNEFSFGLNVAYRFGKMSYSEVLNFNELGSILGSRQSISSRVNDVVLTGGLQYKALLTTYKTRGIQKDSLGNVTRTTPDYAKGLYLTVGAYTSSPLNLNAQITEVYDRFYNSGSGISTIDTVSETNKGSISMNFPISVGAGVTIGDDYRWLIGVDFKHTSWSTFKSLLNEADLKDSWRMAIGFELTPDLSQKSFIKRTSYRLGGYYDSGNLTLSGNTLSEYGITFGFGLPVTRTKISNSLREPSSYINVAFKVGSRGTTQNNLIQEVFFGGSVGFVLNDNWFRKNKYD